jgi:thiamine kinase-like enzyme
MDIRQIKNKLAEIHADNQEAFCGFAHLADGKSNDSYKYVYRGGEYVIRLPKANRPAPERHAAEREIYGLLERHRAEGVDELVYFDPSQGIKITRYIGGARYPDTNNAGDMDRCLSALKKIHLSGIAAPEEFVLIERFEENESRLLTKLKPEDYLKGYEEMRDKAMRAYSGRIDAFMPCFSHLDPIKYNFLLTPRGDYLIDFEYSAMASPMIDLAAFAIYGEYTAEQACRALERYMGGGSAKKDRDSLFKYLPLESIYASIWYLERIAEGPDMEKNMTACFAMAGEYLEEAGEGERRRCRRHHR